VLTPPSPAASGLSLIVRTGDGVIFPLPPFNAIVCPVNAAPLVGNAEVLRVTGIATDTFTIVRTQEGSNARAIQAGDQIYAAITAKTLTDVEALTPIGAIQMFGGATAPVGFLLCDGTTYLKTDYPALSTVLGTIYGGDSTHFAVPDLKGRVAMGAGAGAGLTARSLGSKPGGTEETHLLAAAESGTNGNGGGAATGINSTDHSHTYSGSGTTGADSPDHSHGQIVTPNPGNPAARFQETGSGGYPWNTGSTGGVIDNRHAHGYSWGGTTSGISLNHTHGLNARNADSPHNNIQPSVVLSYIIRAK
jgi:microcystin-dependent protein